MQVIVDFTLIPLGVGASLSPYIALCQKIFRDRGISHQLHAFGTTLEGEWDQVLRAIKECHQHIHEQGAPRISSTIKLGTRTDKSQTMAERIESVKKKQINCS